MKVNLKFQANQILEQQHFKNSMLKKIKNMKLNLIFQTIDKKGYAQADINENNTKLVFQ